MSLKTKSNIVGDIAIVSGCVAFIVVILSMFIEIRYATVGVFALTLLYSEMKNKYLDLRKREIDEQLLDKKRGE